MFEIADATGSYSKLTIAKDRVSIKLSGKYTDEEKNQQIKLAFEAVDDLQNPDMFTLRGEFHDNKGFLLHPRDKKSHIWVPLQ